MEDDKAVDVRNAETGLTDRDAQVLVRFFRFMVVKLWYNQSKGSWKNDNPGALFRRLLEECGELGEILIRVPEGILPDHVVKEAADVANLAMMVSDPNLVGSAKFLNEKDGLLERVLKQGGVPVGFLSPGCDQNG